MRFAQAFEQQYLTAGDLGERTLVVKIDRMQKVTFGKGADAKNKPTLFFEDGTPALVLNKDCWRALEQAFGDSDDWPGATIEIRTEAMLDRDGNPVLDRNNNPSRTFRVRARLGVEANSADAEKPADLPAERGDLDDEIPF